MLTRLADRLIKAVVFGIIGGKTREKDLNKMDGQPSGLVQHGYWHLARIGDGVTHRTNGNHFMKYSRSWAATDIEPMEQGRQRQSARDRQYEHDRRIKRIIK